MIKFKKYRFNKVSLLPQAIQPTQFQQINCQGHALDKSNFINDA